jgi:hypothetical protein
MLGTLVKHIYTFWFLIVIGFIFNYIQLYSIILHNWNFLNLNPYFDQNHQSEKSITKIYNFYFIYNKDKNIGFKIVALILSKE